MQLPVYEDVVAAGEFMERSGKHAGLSLFEVWLRGNPRCLSYHIFFVHERGVISLDFFDLAGWRVKHFQRQNQSAGRATITWDGRDEAGQHLSPGIYLYRLALETDQQKVERVGAVSIVY